MDKRREKKKISLHKENVEELGEKIRNAKIQESHTREQRINEIKMIQSMKQTLKVFFS